MDLKKIDQIIKSNAEKVSLFSQRPLWLKDSLLREKYLDFLEPHGDSYHSDLCPLFSFEIDNIGIIDYFSIVSMRDGVYPLLRFFSLNPLPNDSDCFIIVDDSLAPLVPVTWLDKTLYRRLVFKGEKKICENLMLCLHGDFFSTPLDLLEEELEKMLLMADRLKQVFGFLYFPVPLGEERLALYKSCSEKITMLIAKVVRKFNIEFTMCDFSELIGLQASKIHYHFFNPLKFYVSDSYLDHYFFQKGATPLSLHSLVGDGIYVPVSHQHGFEIYAKKNEMTLPPFEINKIMNVQNLEQYKSGNFEDIFLTTEGFKDWAFDEACRLKKLDC